MLRAIRTGLKWLSEKGIWSCLHHTDTEQSLATDDNSLDFPSDFRLLDKITLSDGTNVSEPLGEVDYEDILIERATGTNAGQPENYCQRARKFELDMDSDGDYDAVIDFWRYHPDQAEILFGAEFEDAVNYAVVGAYLDGKKQHVRARYYYGLAADALPEEAQDDEISMTVYQDLG